MHMFTLQMLFMITSCSNPHSSPQADAVSAIVDPSRSEHFFDAPFPSNEFLDDKKHVDLSAYPQTPSEVTRDIIGGWADRISKTSQGFANHGAVYFRFEGPLDLPTVMTGQSDEPLLLIETETGEQIQ